MRTRVTIICMITLISMATKIVALHIGYGYRSWLGWHDLSIAINPLSGQCLPDDALGCLRMTDCCSNHCAIHPNPQTNICEPNPCGCPQPPWGPINDDCWTYADRCHSNEQCCSGYCRSMLQPTRHGSSRMCWTPPCKICVMP